MKKVLITLITLLLTLSMFVGVNAESTKLLAFPGAVGGGKYATGARGILEKENGKIEVYHVTNLNESGEGSLVDALSKEGRIVVFDVGGTIHLKDSLRMNKSNMTILGQTAPGDGITIVGGDFVITDATKNVIMRHLRVRATDINGGEPDGIGGRFNENVIIDHCSTSWCVDELLTLYAGPKQDSKTAGNHLTIQNTIGSESLRMSNHVKGSHGYGAIWGGDIATYAYNLLAHHDSRSPRMDRQVVQTDVVNNVIYDWGQGNSAYGAEPYSSDKSMKIPSEINWEGNYYKYGPSTSSKLKSRIFQVSAPLSSSDAKTKFYFNGNIMFGNDTVTNNNVSGVDKSSSAEILDAPVSMVDTDGEDYAVERMTAEEAYDYVLQSSGATLPRRDAIDARIVNDVKFQTGRMINFADEVSGLIESESETRVFTIPEEWLSENGLSGKNETDIIESGEFAGYTVIEAYVNDWTEEQYKTPPTNPEIVVQSPAIASINKTIKDLKVDNGNWTVITEGDGVDYKATAFAVGENEVTKMELYDKNTLIGTYEGSSIDAHIDLDEGTHYLTSRAYNTRGEKTQSTTSIVYVKANKGTGSFTSVQIGTPTYKGLGGASLDENGVYSIYGSGRLTTKASDVCQFLYKEVTGDFDVQVKVESIPKFENEQVSGLMVRTGLEPNAAMAMIADGWVKYGENTRIFSRAKSGSATSELYFKNVQGQDCTSELSYNSGFSVPRYIRIQRNGNTLKFSVSNSGMIWNDNARQPMTIEYENLPETLYVGLATDSASGVSTKEYFSSAKFSNLKINGESDVDIDTEEGMPFLDERFDNGLWFSAKNSLSERNGESEALNGNNGYVLLGWGDVVRAFPSQDNGVARFSMDYYTKTTVKDAFAGSIFRLIGQRNSETLETIASFYAKYTTGFYNEYESDEPQPSIEPNLKTSFELEKWYKVEAELDYNTGLGKMSFIPYTNYNSETKTYVTGETLYEYNFKFDTSLAVTQISAERLGGGAMFLDNVSGEVMPVTMTLSAENDKINIKNLTCDASLYVVKLYDNQFVEAKKIDVAPNDLIELDAPKPVDDNEKIVVYLWNKNLMPLCKSIKITK